MAPQVLEELEPVELYALVKYYEEEHLKEVKETNELMCKSVRLAIFNALKGKNHNLFKEEKSYEKKYIDKSEKRNTLKYLKEKFK